MICMTVRNVEGSSPFSSADAISFGYSSRSIGATSPDAAARWRWRESRSRTMIGWLSHRLQQTSKPLDRWNVDVAVEWRVEELLVSVDLECPKGDSVLAIRSM